MIIALDRAPANRGLQTLYVSRPLKNADAFLAWAKDQGFAKSIVADDLHVTIAYSREKVDPVAAGNAASDIVVPASAEGRSIEALGKGAIVLCFDCPDLHARWKEFRDIGAAWDWPDYRPHVTITYDGEGVDLGAVSPYVGPLEFGPEAFAEVVEDWSPKIARDGALAFDRSTVRQYDKDGRLHVALSNISKCAVNPYLGREIPKWRELGLDPEKIYQLFRDPEEMAKAAHTFNNLPLLSRHVPVTSFDHQPDLVIGSTGTDAEFDFPYLRNSLVVWAQESISAIEDEFKKELSSAYHYRADMTPGVYEGEKYDGVMRDIFGNHVAIVSEGRAGPDVVVGDSNEEISMTKTLLSRKAAFACGASLAYLTPKLAQDAKVDLAPAFAGVTAANFKDKKAGIAAAVAARAKGKLAQDADLGDLTQLLDALEDIEVAEQAEDPVLDADPMYPEKKPDMAAKDGDPLMQIKAFLKGKISDDDLAKLDDLMGAPAAMDEDKPEDEEKKDMVTKPAMDAAISNAVAAAHAAAIKTQREIRDAERAVRPYVGELAVALDSAEAVYRTALTAMNVNVDGVHASALPTILSLQPVPGSKPKSLVIAADAAASKSYADMFPDAARIGRA